VVAAGPGVLAIDSACEVGARPGLDSPFGVSDMKGGVLEWVRGIFPPHAVDGSAEYPAEWLLAGSSILHRTARSQMVTCRLAWAASMQVYDTGFRCAADHAPANLPAPPASARPRRRKFIKRVAAVPKLYRRRPIILTPYGYPTFKIEVPWFPRGMWVVDIPEGNAWGGFPGANDWPYRSEQVWRTPWQRGADGALSYTRSQGDRSLAVGISIEDDLVRMRIAPRNLGKIDLSIICIKTLNPFFSSQERETQCAIIGNRLVPVNRLPLRPDSAVPFGWGIGSEMEYGAVVMRAHDGSGYAAIIGYPGCQCWGNGWPHCTHLVGKEMKRSGASEILMLFQPGSERDLIRRVGELAAAKR